MPLLYCRHLDRRIDWKVTVPDSDFTIGCSESATVPVPDATLSPREVSISKKGERYLLQDLAERGQVLLAGAVTRTGLLKDGDRFRVGRIAFLFIENPKVDSGQVELYRDATPTFDVLDGPVPAPPVRRPEPRIPNEVEIPRGVWVGVLILAIFTGMCLGVLFTGGGGSSSSTSAKGAAPEPVTGKREDRPAEPAGGKAIDEAIARVKSEKPAPAPASPERMRLADAPNGAPDRQPPRSLEARKESAGPSPSLALTLDVSKDPAVSRIALFRLFLDLAGRPPTRLEEKELLPLDHDGRWRRIVESAAREGTLPDMTAPVEAQFFLFIGRKPELEESQEIARLATTERPALYWIAAMDEYRRLDRRRPRPPFARARSFIVDLLDRPPSSPDEVEAVRKALAAPGSILETARTLVHSSRGAQSSSAGAGDLEAEVCRFLLRPLDAGERSKLEAALAGQDAASRRPWLLLALATHEDYEKY